MSSSRLLDRVADLCLHGQRRPGQRPLPTFLERVSVRGRRRDARLVLLQQLARGPVVRAGPRAVQSKVETNGGYEARLTGGAVQLPDLYFYGVAGGWKPRVQLDLMARAKIQLDLTNSNDPSSCRWAARDEP